MAVVSVDTSGFQKKWRRLFASLSKPQRQKILKRAGMRLLRKQIVRIGKGRGSNGKPFPAYTKRYQKKRKESGRKPRPRVLRWTGQMLGARTLVRVTPDEVIIGFKPTSSGDGPSAIEKAAYNERRTPFVKPTKKESRESRKFLRKQIDAAIKKAAGTGS